MQNARHRIPKTTIRRINQDLGLVVAQVAHVAQWHISAVMRLLQQPMIVMPQDLFNPQGPQLPPIAVRENVRLLPTPKHANRFAAGIEDCRGLIVQSPLSPSEAPLGHSTSC